MFDGDMIEWAPEMDRIDSVVVKNARGHVAYEYSIPVISDPISVSVMPFAAMSREAIEDSLFAHTSSERWPEIGCRMMTRALTGEAIRDGWIVVQEGVYEYLVEDFEYGARVRTMIYGYLATDTIWEDLYD
ncbi:MAG: hypothetical protein OXG25_10300 [Gammaproteobacteria bacterium]|nr:hypothetical protein [Gammaproteobacteria bacterium]